MFDEELSGLSDEEKRKKKPKRASNKVGNQEDILEILSSMGHEITQATLSRDLKELKVAKTPDGVGGYHYKLPGNVPNAQPDKVNLGND